MNTRYCATGILFLIAIWANPSTARVLLSTTSYGGNQVGTSENAAAGVSAMGFTNKHSLSVGAGFTVICEGSFGSIDWSDGRSENGFYDFGFTVKVPLSPPGSYLVPKFNTWLAGDPHVCDFKYRGIAAEGAFQVQGGGAGVTFGIGLGENSVQQSGTIFFEMIRPVGAQCTPGRNCCLP